MFRDKYKTYIKYFVINNKETNEVFYNDRVNINDLYQ